MDNFIIPGLDPKTSFEIPVSYNLDNPRNFGFKVLNGGKAIGFDDNATNGFDENSSLKIESFITEISRIHPVCFVISV